MALGDVAPSNVLRPLRQGRAPVSLQALSLPLFRFGCCFRPQPERPVMSDGWKDETARKATIGVLITYAIIAVVGLVFWLYNHP